MKIDKLDEVTILFGISDNNPGNCLLILKAKTTETRKLEFSIAKKQWKRISSLQKIEKFYRNFPFLASQVSDI